MCVCVGGVAERERIQDPFALSQGEISQREGLRREGMGPTAGYFGSKSVSLSQIQINSICNLVNCRGNWGHR